MATCDTTASDTGFFVAAWRSWVQPALDPDPGPPGIANRRRASAAAPSSIIHHPRPDAGACLCYFCSCLLDA